MSAYSAGILLHRHRQGELEVLLVHPGGPFWTRRDDGAWMIPKGEPEPGDVDPLATARREFTEELGVAPPDTTALDLGEITQRSGKRVRAFALAGELDAEGITSNTTVIEWPPRSGRKLEIPEVDRAAWFALPQARVKLLAAQLPLLDRLESLLAAGGARSQDG